MQERKERINVLLIGNDEQCKLFLRDISRNSNLSEPDIKEDQFKVDGRSEFIHVKEFESFNNEQIFNTFYNSRDYIKKCEAVIYLDATKIDKTFGNQFIEKYNCVSLEYETKLPSGNECFKNIELLIHKREMKTKSTWVFAALQSKNSFFSQLPHELIKEITIFYFGNAIKPPLIHVLKLQPYKDQEEDDDFSTCSIQ
jgi:hypothetical protein